ncbi:cupin domain-containing protein [Pseudogemmobacter sonorensis]|uniref:cupin domain-containing protein n=1 Tax=Pseudogemmobacter sonorensis TaxID=2989681 RepID=UPI00369370E4
MAIRVFHRDHPTLRLPLISKDARFVIWPGTDAWNANLNYVVLEPGEANVPHVHQISEDTIFILSGKGTAVDYTNDLSLPFHAGCLVHVPVGVKHAVHADLGERIVSVGGPAPADVPLLRKAGALAPDAEVPAGFCADLPQEAAQ